MRIELFRLSDGYTADFESALLTPTHCIEFPLSLDRENYLVAIDPGTVSMGFVISDTVAKMDLYNITFKRSTKNNPEDQDTFVNNFLIFYEYLIKSGGGKYKYLKIEQPFVDKSKSPDTYVALKKVLDGTVSVSKRYGMLTYPTPPPSWQSWYLTPYKEIWGLKLNASNKDSIKKIGLNEMQQFEAMIEDPDLKYKFTQFLIKYAPKGAKSDLFDAKGLAKTFFCSRFF